MKIYYPKRRLLTYLSIGVLMTVFSTYRIFGQHLSDFSTYLLLLLGITYIAGCIYFYKKQYIKVTSHKIIVNSILPYELVINNIIEARLEGDRYTFRTETKEITFEKSQIDEENKENVEEFYRTIKQNLNKK